MERVKPTVFIVEDERLTALAIEMGLEQLGYNIFGVASDVDAAIEATRCHDYNVAVLDLDLNGRRVDPVAHALSRRQIPFIVASAYQISDDMPEVVRSAPRVGKPYGVEHLQRAIAAARRPG